MASEPKRRRLFDAQKGLCAYCEKPIEWVAKGEDRDHRTKPTIDHVIPKIHGGGSNIENLVLVHMRCNTIKADLMPEEILALLTGMRKTFKNLSKRVLPAHPPVAPKKKHRKQKIIPQSFSMAPEGIPDFMY